MEITEKLERAAGTLLSAYSGKNSGFDPNPTAKLLKQAYDHIVELESEVERLRKDQRRLEWLANVGIYKGDGFDIVAPLLESNWRDAIDSAMENGDE